MTSARVDALSESSELFYRRLHSIVDDYGRHEAHPELLRTKCYPLRVDRVKAKHVVSWLAECEKAALLVVYKVGSKTYLQLTDWRQQQRSDSKCPAPDTQLLSKCLADAHLVVGVVGDVVEGVSEGVGAVAQQSRPQKANGHRIDFDFSKGAFKGITEEDELRWQQAFQAVPIPPAIERAAAWLKANPANHKSNYERFLVNWFSREQDKAGRVRH